MLENERSVPKIEFLKDVLICSLGAYGGPEAHYGIFANQLVEKKRYITEEELTELMALTSILPGPSSTQTIVAIGHKIGGVPLALITMLIWSFPGILIMTALSFLGLASKAFHFDPRIFRYIQPMAVAFILMATYNIGRKVIKSKVALLLFFFGAILSYFFKGPLVFLGTFLVGGITAILLTKEKNIFNKITLNPPWKYLGLFAFFAIGLVVFNMFIDHRLLLLLEKFYRFGYLVIGGGQVVVPLMHGELVEIHQFMTSQEFLTGYGIVQGVPGPMFSFTAYAGGMAARDLGYLMQVLAAFISSIGIFLPGILLIFFVFPIWEDLKKMRAIKISIGGISPVACGLIFASAIGMIQKSGLGLDNILVIIISCLLLLSKKVPAPLMVLSAILLGVLL